MTMAEAQADTQTGTDVATQDDSMRKFDPAVLKAIGSSPITSMGAIFQPTTMAEAMEYAKMIAASRFMPPHLRGKPADCLAVVMFAARVNADAYAVGSKTFFVNDRMAFEAQLVAALLNTSRVLDGRLAVTWDGVGENMICKVEGRIKGDPNVHAVWQEMKDVKTRNSPLWKSNQRQQLAYLTQRMWARLYAPEVLLGIYTPDEAEEMVEVPADPSQPEGEKVQVIPPKPTRESFEQMRKEAAENESRFRQQTAADNKADPETGEIAEAEAEPEQVDESEPVEDNTDWDLEAKKLRKGLLAVGKESDKFKQFMDASAGTLERMKAAAPGYFAKLDAEIQTKAEYLKSQK